MKVKDRFAQYERRARVLERIAKKYPEDSAEYRTLEIAGYALCFALTQEHEEFTEYVAEMTRPPTKKEERAMERHLKELGLKR